MTDSLNLVAKTVADHSLMLQDRVTKLEHRVLSLCSLVHYLIETPDFYEKLQNAEPFDLGKVLAEAPSPYEFFEEARKNNARADAERHLKTVGIHLPNARPEGTKFVKVPLPKI